MTNEPIVPGADETQEGSTPIINVNEVDEIKLENEGGGASNIMEQEYVLPSGGKAKIEKFVGWHVLEALTTGDGSSDKTEEAMLWRLICATVTLDGNVKITAADVDEMDGRDVDFLLQKFSDAIDGKDAATLPETMPEPPKDHRWKLLPNGLVALIEKYKGKHVKQAQRQMSGDGKDYLPVLMSRMIKVGPAPDKLKDLFPEDLYEMDGMAFLSLMGEVAEAMFPATVTP